MHFYLCTTLDIEIGDTGAAHQDGFLLTGAFTPALGSWYAFLAAESALIVT